MVIAPVVDTHPLLEVELCSIFEDDTISIIAIASPSTPTRNVRAASNKKLYNSLSTDKKLLGIVESLYKWGINRQRAQQMEFNRASPQLIGFYKVNKRTTDKFLPECTT